MSDVDRRDGKARVDCFQRSDHLVAQGRVEAGQRFVEQQELRAGQQRAGERDAPLLTSGEVRDRSVEQGFESRARRRLLRSPAKRRRPGALRSEDCRERRDAERASRPGVTYPTPRNFGGIIVRAEASKTTRP